MSTEDNNQEIKSLMGRLKIMVIALLSKYYFTVLVLFIAMTADSFAQLPCHDPSTMVKGDDGRYWIFTTGHGIRCRSSEDTSFENWRGENKPFADGEWPSWIDTVVPGFKGHFWAPDVIFMNGNYYVFYSASTWGSSKSAIGVVRTPSLLDPEWIDLGEVVRSDGSREAINAIDPGLFRDTDGRIWMTYGSWFGGIGVVEIDSISGMTIGNITNVHGGNHQDIEAPYIIKKDDSYYLFVNYGLCCKGLNSTYYVKVSRSDSVTGPYTDFRVFLNTDGRFIGPGHISYGEGRLTYHYYDGEDDGKSKLKVATMVWENGWPKAY